MESTVFEVRVSEGATATRALGLPLAFTLGLAAFLLLDSVRQNTPLTWTFAGASAVLLTWNAVLLASAVRSARTLSVEIVLRKQHYLQACIQGSLLVYWGWYWRQVYDSAHLIAAQLLFAYTFDMLLSWSRRDVYALGFGPFPVVFSMNLFLWFRPDWFYFQFLMVAFGFAAKELLRWDKDGRSVHIFNPSSFPLAVFSLALIATSTTDLTWGQDIATTLFYPPHMYLALFLFALPGQFLFGVTTMTMSAVVTTYLFGLLYYATTGIYFFYDSYIPIAVFLGMHLLFTDPATSPRTDLGRVIFGVLYGASTIALYALLGNLGVPTFYDKLLQIPILNLSIELIDRLARSNTLQRIDPTAILRPLAPRRRHLAYMAAWAVVFAVMSAVQGVGDSHPGQWLPFWQQACAEGRPYACPYLESIVSSDCDRGSMWACEELAILQDDSDRYHPRTLARASADDYPIVLRGSKGPIRNVSRAGLEALACHEGWPGTCD
ncbi:MAG TPA: hypothetical protein VFU28_06550 [Vicinamibacterales bacterium]|nr:hypothetical protein [Vicinamibacterales bacterium]